LQAGGLQPPASSFCANRLGQRLGSWEQTAESAASGRGLMVEEIATYLQGWVGQFRQVGPGEAMFGVDGREPPGRNQRLDFGKLAKQKSALPLHPHHRVEPVA